MATKCKDRVLIPFDYGHRTGVKHATRRLSRASFRGETAIRQSVAAGSRQSAVPPLLASDRTIEPLTPGISNRLPSDHFPIDSVDDEDDANDLSILAGNLEDIGVSAQVRAHHRRVAVAQAVLAAASGALEGKPVPLMNRGDPLVGEPLAYPLRLVLCSPGR
jgi:hypothetical protein